MKTIEYEDGTRIEFEGEPTEQDIQEAYNSTVGQSSNPMENFNNLQNEGAGRISRGLGNIAKGAVKGAGTAAVASSNTLTKFTNRHFGTNLGLNKSGEALAGGLGIDKDISGLDKVAGGALDTFLTVWSGGASALGSAGLAGKSLMTAQKAGRRPIIDATRKLLGKKSMDIAKPFSEKLGRSFLKKIPIASVKEASTQGGIQGVANWLQSEDGDVAGHILKDAGLGAISAIGLGYAGNKILDTKLMNRISKGRGTSDDVKKSVDAVKQEYGVKLRDTDGGSWKAKQDKNGRFVDRYNKRMQKRLDDGDIDEFTPKIQDYEAFSEMGIVPKKTRAGTFDMDDNIRYIDDQSELVTEELTNKIRSNPDSVQVPFNSMESELRSRIGDDLGADFKSDMFVDTFVQSLKSKLAKRKGVDVGDSMDHNGNIIPGGDVILNGEDLLEILRMTNRKTKAYGKAGEVEADDFERLGQVVREVMYDASPIIKNEQAILASLMQARNFAESIEGLKIPKGILRKVIEGLPLVGDVARRTNEDIIIALKGRKVGSNINKKTTQARKNLKSDVVQSRRNTAEFGEKTVNFEREKSGLNQPDVQLKLEKRVEPETQYDPYTPESELPTIQIKPERKPRKPKSDAKKEADKFLKNLNKDNK